MKYFSAYANNLWYQRRKNYHNLRKNMNFIQRIYQKTKVKLQPFKFKRIKKPKFSIPDNLQVLKHTNNLIPYEGNQYIYIMNKRIFLERTNQKQSVVQMPIHQYQIPLVVKNNFTNIRSVNLWIYKGKRVTDWHYDGSDNFLYLMKGTKKIQLLPPNTLKSKNVFSLSYNHLKDSHELKLFSKLIKNINIKQGQCIFIPKGWWHHVISEGQPSIALNFWGNSFDTIQKAEYENLLKYLIFTIGEDKCQKQLPQWQKIDDENLKIMYRQLYFKQFLNQRIL